MRILGILGVLVLLAALWWLLEGRSAAREALRGPGRAHDAARAPSEPLAGRSAPAPALVENPGATEAGRTVLALEDDSEPGLELGVLVSDCASGRPLEGARVACLESSVPPLYRTDENGQASVRVRDSRQPVTLRVEAAGYAHQQLEVSRRSPLEVCLNRTVTLAGRVLTADTHEPVPGARLSLAHVDCDACAPDTVVAGPDGRYELPDVPLFVEVELAIEVAGHEPDPHAFLLRTGEPRLEQDLFFVRGVEIAGRVEDWVSGAPLAGARVAGLATDEAGRFAGRVRPELGSPLKTLQVSAPGHAMLEACVELGHARELVFRLPGFAAIEGALSDIAGRPIEGGIVSCIVSGPEEGEGGEPLATSPLYELPAGWSFSAPDDCVASDARGHYRLEHALPWALGVEIHAHARGFESETVAFARLGEPGSLQEVDLVLRPATESRITGAVTLNGAFCQAFLGTVSWRSAGSAGQAAIVGGRYEFAVEPGEAELEFSLAEVRGPLEGARAVVRVEAGCSTAYTARLIAPKSALEGRVRLEDGPPVEGGIVMATALAPRTAEGQGPLWSTRTDADGRFRLDVPDIGTAFDLLVHARQQSLARQGIAPGTTGLEFVLGPAQALLLRAVDARSRLPIELGSMRLYARSSGAVGFTELRCEDPTPDASGWYRAWASAEALDLLALPSLPSHALELRSHVALGPEPTRVEFVLRPGLELAIELDSEVGPWPAGEPLVLLPEGLWSELVSARKVARGDFSAKLRERHAVVFDPQGRAVLHGLAPGRYRFRSATRALALVPDMLVVDERFPAPVRVRLRAAR